MPVGARHSFSFGEYIFESAPKVCFFANCVGCNGSARYRAESFLDREALFRKERANQGGIAATSPLGVFPEGVFLLLLNFERKYRNENLRRACRSWADCPGNG